MEKDELTEEFLASSGMSAPKEEISICTTVQHLDCCLYHNSTKVQKRGIMLQCYSIVI